MQEINLMTLGQKKQTKPKPCLTTRIPERKKNKEGETQYSNEKMPLIFKEPQGLDTRAVNILNLSQASLYSDVTSLFVICSYI